MIYFKFQDLSKEAQEELLQVSREDVEHRFGESIRKYVEDKYIDDKSSIYERLIDEETIKNLYTYDYAFNI